MRKTIFLGLLLAFFMPLASFAWGPTGHRVVAEIAYQHLTPQARKAIGGILGRQSLAMIANWPDFIKSDTTKQYNHTSTWHYLDFPGHINRQVFDSLLQAATGENLYTEIHAMMKDLKNRSLAKDKQRFALSFLVHMVGDLHMPLHAGRDEDMGGNKINVMWFDKASNLHRVWDEHLIDFQQLSYTEYTKAIDIASPAEVKTLQSGTIADWLFDAHQLSDKIYDYTKPDAKLSYRYNYVFVDDLNQQLLKGGLRLAALLNSIYK
ncbi:S1/P1 nuclease [Chitinophaga nivalis]|uniref:S1/P1 nuclease n=1 Tax=Chitinophaga nivalis TaxID=2991709 RepID=A0ABT3IUS0_9BACT|nr:S1/P1 nuclease [Chitinophaga nivalis]MCW3462624.1 S1/P1 nuclease [Chitinophaga nivalis]MCW3487685.1 S1/P1 nuclease [Chitinophaga nivalis]